MKKEINTEIEKKENSTAEITVTIKSPEFEKYRERGLNKIKEIAEVDGFRKGHAPENLILSKYGEMAIFEEMANIAIDETFTDAILDSKLDIIGRPEVSITKIAPKNDFEYKIIVSLMPELTLPDYVKIAASVKKDEVKVEEKDIEEVLLELRKMRAHKELHLDGKEHKEGDALHDESHNEIETKKEEELPELDDEYVKELGDFKSIEDLKSKVEENLKLEKVQKNTEKRRNEILEKIEKETKGVLPEVLIESETERMLSEMKGNVAQMGGKFEDYLTYIKKTENDMKKEWRADAEKRAKIQLIINQIAKEKKIVPNSESVELEAKRLMDMYKDADKNRATEYMYQMLLNEEVLKSLEV